LFKAAFCAGLSGGSAVARVVRSRSFDVQCGATRGSGDAGIELFGVKTLRRGLVLKDPSKDAANCPLSDHHFTFELVTLKLEAKAAPLQLGGAFQ